MRRRDVITRIASVLVPGVIVVLLFGPYLYQRRRQAYDSTRPKKIEADRAQERAAEVEKRKEAERYREMYLSDEEMQPFRVRIKELREQITETITLTEEFYTLRDAHLPDHINLSRKAAVDADPNVSSKYYAMFGGSSKTTSVTFDVDKLRDTDARLRQVNDSLGERARFDVYKQITEELAENIKATSETVTTELATLRSVTDLIPDVSDIPDSPQPPEKLEPVETETPKWFADLTPNEQKRHQDFQKWFDELLAFTEKQQRLEQIKQVGLSCKTLILLLQTHPRVVRPPGDIDARGAELNLRAFSISELRRTTHARRATLGGPFLSFAQHQFWNRGTSPANGAASQGRIVRPSIHIDDLQLELQEAIVNHPDLFSPVTSIQEFWDLFLSSLDESYFLSEADTQILAARHGMTDVYGQPITSQKARVSIQGDPDWRPPEWSETAPSPPDTGPIPAHIDWRGITVKQLAKHRKAHPTDVVPEEALIEPVPPATETHGEPIGPELTRMEFWKLFHRREFVISGEEGGNQFVYKVSTFRPRASTFTARRRGQDSSITFHYGRDSQLHWKDKLGDKTYEFVVPTFTAGTTEFKGTIQGPTFTPFTLKLKPLSE